MVKKKVHKTKKSKPSTQITQSTSEVKVEKILIENFVSLQKVMTNLTIKFDKLSNQISELLNIFEISAKALAEKNPEIKDKEEQKKIIEKLDNLAEQNKTIARGLTLLHEPINQTEEQRRMPGPAKEYQKSISSEFKPI